MRLERAATSASRRSAATSASRRSAATSASRRSVACRWGMAAHDGISDRLLRAFSVEIPGESRATSRDTPRSHAHADPVDAEVVSLLRHFVGTFGGEVQVAVRRGSGRSDRWEQSTEIDESVTGFDPEAGVVEIELRGGQQVRLHFTEVELLKLLADAGASGTEVWQQPLSDEEAAARFLTIYLGESIATQEAHPTGWWEYEDCRFRPVPPWEAAARRRQGH
jgi:hypothetical protein